jgi:peptidyl-prolyl cis-trans isomerase B (cyclophilin B)
VPTNKQRREAARRHLERQLQRREETNSKRKQRNLIITVISSVVVVLVVIVLLVVVSDQGKHKTPAAAPSTPAASASDTSTDTASAAPSTSAAPMPQTAGPCGYTQAGTATKNVGFPPDPTPTPTINRVVTFTTNKGPVTMTLDGATAPCTVQSIAYLVGKKLYDGTKCFRLVTSGIYVLQCGDPANTGSGGPGYEVKDESLSSADYSKVGTVAMANAGPGTDGSQFFIIYKDSSTGLQKSYTVIGQITAGMDIIQQVAAGGEDDANGTGDGAPKIPLTITTATVAPPVVGSGTMVTPAATAPAAASTPAAATGSVPVPATTPASGG